MFFAKKGHFQLRDHQQIAFVMLSRFCLLSKTPLTSPVPLSYNAMENTGRNGSWMEYQPKLNQKYIPFCLAFQILKVLLIKVYKIQPIQFFYFLFL